MAFFRKKAAIVRKRGKAILREGYSYAKKRYGTRGGLVRLAKDVSRIKGMLNVELKHHDIEWLPTTIPRILTGTGGWTLVTLNPFPGGTSSESRVGNSVRCKSLQIRGKLERVAETFTGRMIVFIDKEPLTGTPVPEDLLEFTSTVNPESRIHALRKWDTICMKRYTVLHDKRIRLDGDNQQFNFDIYKKLNMVTKWRDNDTQQIQNILHIAFMADTTDAGFFTFQSRVTAVDN